MVQLTISVLGVQRHKVLRWCFLVGLAQILGFVSLISFQPVSWLAEVFVSESSPRIKSNHCKSDLPPWRYSILNHNVFSLLIPWDIEAGILLSFLADRRVSFPGNVGIHFAHVLGVERKQHNIAVWYHAEAWIWGYIFPKKWKMNIGPKIAGFDSWLCYLWNASLIKLLSILSLFTHLLNGENKVILRNKWDECIWKSDHISV